MAQKLWQDPAILHLNREAPHCGALPLKDRRSWERGRVLLGSKA